MSVYAGQDHILNHIKNTNWISLIDVEKVLSEANLRKSWVEESNALRLAEQEERKNRYTKLQAQHNAAFFWLLIKRYFLINYGEFVHNKTNSRYIEAICYFFSSDARFETKLGFDFNKGLLIKGNAGLGKTKVIQAISGNELHPVSIYSLLDISDKVKENGFFYLNTDRIILLDDVGTEEPTVKHYGTNVNWFKEFIEKYYLNNKRFSNLLITTNCGGQELEDKYGYRVRSRIREMFNVIELTGKDLRK